MSSHEQSPSLPSTPAFAAPLAASAPTAPPGAAPGAWGAQAPRATRPRRALVAAIAARMPSPELLALAVLAGSLNLWALSRNGWANEYYSAAVRSMSSSWHNFLFASLDPSGVMTVDKPPLSLWVQSLSVRVFGYHPLSMLAPQALMGVASVMLTYDLVRRRFGRFGGLIAGVALATTPMVVAVSRHNNPDALLVLCSVAALWCAVRALEHGRTRWLVASGVCVGLGFETKMGVALVVVPGICAAWLWIVPAARGWLHSLRALLAAGAAMVLVGGAWPALVALTPAADRPWVAGTSDNSIFSLIFGYNGLGRVDGQAGGPGGFGGSMFGGASGPTRLFNAALGGQAGWLLAFAAIAALALAARTRLRRADPRSGWLLAVGGAFLTSAALFSVATGIFHPYYVALLAPFIAALTGAGAVQLIEHGRSGRIFAALALAAGVAGELVVRSRYPGQLQWLPAVLIGLSVLAAIVLVISSSSRARVAAASVAVGALLLAPSVWALDTLGYAASGTFPAGGPQSAQAAGGGPMGLAGGRLARGLGFGTGPSGAPPGAGGGPRLFGPGGAPPAGAPSGAAPPGFAPPRAFGGSPRGVGGFGGPFGGDAQLTRVLAYVKRHGGGTIAVSSQSSAAAAIIANNADVAGIGGFSGRESDPSAAWLAERVRTGAIRWVLADQGGLGAGPKLPGDSRTGSKTALAAAAKACLAVTLPTAASTSASTSGASAVAGVPGSSGSPAAGVLYDCRGRSSQLLAAGA